MLDFTDKGLGRRPAPDARDRRFLVRILTDAVPIYKRPSMWYQTGPTLDQGPYPYCVGYAWRQWLSSSLIKTKTGPLATDIYTEAQKVDEWDGEDYAGTSVRGGAKFLKAKGHISNYYWAFSTEEVKDFILKRLGTVVLGTNWYESMFYPDERAYVKVEGSIAGGHAYLCVGYSKPRDAFRCINSWGVEFGQGGRFWILRTDLERLITEQGEACCATEVKLAT